MLRFLFPRLTAEPRPRSGLFAWVTAQARAPHWYLAGEVEDSIDGRFAMLATIAALTSVRLEGAGEPGLKASVELTERFIEAMESEHREMGLGDPKLGRTVRKLVGSLGRRVELWRTAAHGADWTEATRESVYGRGQPSTEALERTSAELRKLWTRLEATSADAVAEGLIR